MHNHLALWHKCIHVSIIALLCCIVMFHMLHEMMSILMFKVLWELMYVNLLKQVKFCKIKIVVQSEYFLMESKSDDVPKSNMLNLCSKN